MNILFRWSLFAALAVLPAACATDLPVPKEAALSQVDQDWPGTKLSDLLAGRRSYADHCAACHLLKPPSHFTQFEWTRIMRRMQVIAKIDDPTADSILRYLFAVSPKTPPKD